MSQEDFLLPAGQLTELRGYVEALMRDQVLGAQALREERRAAHQATEAFCLELLDVADMLSSQIAFLEAQPEEGPWRRLARNLSRTRNKLVGSLEKRGVTVVPVEPGGEPDYRTCVAVERRETTDAQNERVAEVLRDGFMIEDRVLRPAEIAVQVPAGVVS